MAATAIYIDEFLYRGRAPGDDQPPAWHLILRSIETDAFDRRKLSDPLVLNIQQAEELGFSLPAVISTINTELAQTIERQNAEMARLTQELEEVRAELAIASNRAKPEPAVELLDEAAILEMARTRID